jgi:hypothetical protein
METLNITKTALGIEFLNIQYQFREDKEFVKLSDTECHIYMTECIVYFNTSATIEGEAFEDIDQWITKLYE